MDLRLWRPLVSRLRARSWARLDSRGRRVLWAWLGIAGTVAVAWVACMAAGGSKTAMPHAFYIPVVAAAIRFGPWAVLATALTAGLVAGPLLPLDVVAGTSQAPGNWVARLGFFVVIGLLTAYLSHYSLSAIAAERANRRLRSELGDAITGGQLRLEYQPIIDVATGDMVGAEALIRWDHPRRGPISPAVFIPHAERARCISHVSHFVIAEACRQVGRWRSSGLLPGAGFTLAVNISAGDLDDQHLLGHIREQLDQADLPGDWLSVEITETDLVVNLDRALDALDALRTLDIHIAIDDFGIGESSLANLHRYPVDVVKIDRLFINRLDDGADGENMTRAVIDLAHAMGVRALAEGVETPAQAAMLRDLHADLTQGYLFSRPQRPEVIEAMLTDPDTFRTSNQAHLSRGAETSASSPADLAHRSVPAQLTSRHPS